jgi:hypothetical protein
MSSGHEPGSIRRNKVSFEYHSSNSLSGKIQEVSFHLKIPDHSIRLLKKLDKYRNVDYYELQNNWPKQLLKALQHPLKVQQHLSPGAKKVRRFGHINAKIRNTEYKF